MHKLGINLDQARLLCRKARPSIYPNPGFVVQLKDYERKLRNARFK